MEVLLSVVVLLLDRIWERVEVYGQQVQLMFPVEAVVRVVPQFGQNGNT